jgi:xylitol oxidase
MIEFVAADGSIQRLSRAEDPDRFPGAVVSLGALGILTKVTLKVQPRYDMTQVVYQT